MSARKKAAEAADGPTGDGSDVTREGPFALLQTDQGPAWVNVGFVTDVHAADCGTHVHLTNGRCYKVALPPDEVAALLV